MDQKENSLMPEKISAITKIELLEDEMLVEQLAAWVDHLINTDFQGLINFLYRMDVDEQKLESLLKKYAGENAGKIIAALIIQRQIQKITFRESQRRDINIDEEEKW